MINGEKYHVSKNLFDLSAYYSVDSGITNISIIGNELSFTTTGTYRAIKYQFPFPYYSRYTVYFSEESEHTALEIRRYKNGTMVGNTVTVFAGAAQTLYNSEDYDEIRIYISNRTYVGDCKITNIMLNTGSSALPFEPYSSEVWHDTPISTRKLHNATDNVTSLPVDIYTDGQNASADIKGNMSQTGTPTPTTPIQPQECGERTGNLFSSEWEQGSIDSYGTDYPSDTVVRTKNYIPVIPNTIYSISRNIANSYMNLRFYNGNKQYIDRGTSTTIRLISGNTEANPMGVGIGFCCFEIIDTNIRYMRVNDNSNNVATQYMMVEGQYTASTIPAYEPYGIKIPISSANTTMPVYLGEVESTRKIGKLVLTGNEAWSFSTSGNAKRAYLTDWRSALGNSLPLCTHYIGNSGGGSYPSDGKCLINSNGVPIFNANFVSDKTEWIAYLQQQYAAGTPVCVWYVLATPQTAVVNEPLRKIGNYADTVSGVSIPTTTGKDTFDVLTTLKPSEVELTYTGWHDATAKEWDGSQWH